MRISKRRAEMGEEKWKEYQKERQKRKIENWIKNNPEKNVEFVEKRKAYSIFWRVRAKEELMKYKGGKCSICGYCKDVPSAYDFHHRVPTEKNFSIGSYSVLNMQKLKEEVDKCDLVCRNCHAEIHGEQYNKIRKLMLEKHISYMEKRKPKEEIRCKICSNTFVQKNSKQKYCSPNCADKGRRKVVRPDSEELKELLKTETFIRIGEIYGVSNNAVKKWAKKYGII